MKTLVTYKSKTGFTKKYAEWIAKELNCDLLQSSKVNTDVVKGYDLVIHGGWIMGGMVMGLDKIRKTNPNSLIAFGVGFTKKEHVDINNIKNANKIDDIPFFYYEGGTEPKKMGFLGRNIVKLVTKKPVVFVDNTNKDYIKELVVLATNNTQKQ